MSKAEFMGQLEKLLSDIPEGERAEALNYYEEYFSDAGPENEQRVLLELGSPWLVAQTIREGLQTETTSAKEDMAEDGQREEEKTSLPDWAIVLLVLGCILGSPLILAFVATVLGLFIGLLGIIVGFAAAGVSLVVAGVAVLIVGIVNCGLLSAIGVMFAGAGLIIFALGILFVMLTVWLCGFALPAICRLLAKPFRRKKSV